MFDLLLNRLVEFFLCNPGEPLQYRVECSVWYGYIVGIGSVGFKCRRKRRIRGESENQTAFTADSHAVFGSEPNITADVA